jgi:hypothetical protein
MVRPVLLGALFVLAVSASAQDVLTIGSGTGQNGGTAAIRVSIRDIGGTSLGVDSGVGNRIQGFAFKVLFPTEIVTSVTFSRHGVAASITPLYETALQGSGWSSAIVSFNETSNPIGFHLNAVAPGDSIGMLTVAIRADAPIGSVAALVLDPPSATLSNQAGTVRETVAGGNLSLVNGSVTVSAIAAPANLVATASGTSSVNVTWNHPAGASSWEVWRSSFGSEFAFVANRTGLPFYIDTNVAADTTYLYQVRGVNGADASAFSAIDPATTVAFTDDPIAAMSTSVKAIHFTQLRTAVNAMRAAASLGALASDPTVTAGGIVRAHHITDLRAGLDEARTLIGLAALSYTDPTLTIGATAVKETHVTELRNGVK